jgi:uncharacterized protein YfdQ (DUF2303 family)
MEKPTPTTPPPTSPLVPFDFKTAIDFGKTQVIKSEVGDIPVFIVPESMKVHDLSNLVEAQLPRPRHLKQGIELLTEESFVEYFNRYATESSTIFVNDKDSTLTAVFDYHESHEVPAWKRHTAFYKCPKTKEWGAWMECNNKKMEQELFALFIEENLKEITEPDGATMLQIASTLKASSSTDFRSAIRLDNGEVQFNYTEKIEGQAGVTAQLQIPEKITLVVAPFMKGAAYQVEARFRYRIAQGGLTMWYTLIRPHVFVDDAFNDVVNKINEGKKTGHLVHAIPPA